MSSPAPYFDLVREMKDAYNHRLRLVDYARQNGMKAAARAFQTTIPPARTRLGAHGLLHRRRGKYQKKQDLAAVKATWRLFQQISADTKDLDDLPSYWPQAQRYRLPSIEYTAREVRSGLLFLAFAQ